LPGARDDGQIVDYSSFIGHWQKWARVRIGKTVLSATDTRSRCGLFTFIATGLLSDKVSLCSPGLQGGFPNSLLANYLWMKK
jgi:hypothetical protein